MFTNEQLFTKQFKADDLNSNLRFYLAPQKENNFFVAQALGLPVVKVMHPKLGSFATYERTYVRTPASNNVPHGIRFTGTANPGSSYPVATDTDVVLLSPTDAEEKWFNVVLCAYSETVTSSFQFTFGEGTPTAGYGNIIIDDTNVTLTLNDGTVRTTPHGVTIVADSFHMIGASFQILSSVNFPYAIKNTGTPPVDFATAQIFGDTGLRTGQAITINDTFNGGTGASGGNGISLIGAACWISEGIADLPIQLYNWYHGMNAITNEILDA